MPDTKQRLREVLNPSDIRRRLSRCAKEYLFWTKLLAIAEEVQPNRDQNRRDSAESEVPIIARCDSALVTD